MKHAKLAFLSAAIALTSATAVFAKASASMHYGLNHSNAGQLKSKAPSDIVITNCTFSPYTVQAWFTDGSYGNMGLAPVNNAPYNVISIGDPFPYVTIEVDAMDGTPVFPQQAVYPYQHVNIGCNSNTHLAPHAKVSVTVTR